jgi:formylglycine-generating enzyme required for sulfatase activity
VQQFDTFVKATGYAYSKTCNAVKHGNINAWYTVGASYLQPPAPFSQGPEYPVVCVTWPDAVAYTNWLAETTGRRYRLPSEAEWEYAARAGTATAYAFGDDQNDLCDYAWVADEKSPFGSEMQYCVPATDRPRDYGPSPAGLLKANPWGLFDMHGNVWEFVADCWSSSPGEGAMDQRPWQPTATCDRVQRGGSFTNGGFRTRSAARSRVRENNPAFHSGFRVAVSIDG